MTYRQPQAPLPARDEPTYRTTNAAYISEHETAEAFSSATRPAATMVAPGDPRNAPPAAIAARQVLNAIGVPIYTTDAEGRITFYNEAATTLWGRRPLRGEEWCGSLRLFHLDGLPMSHRDCPMAIALREDRALHGPAAIVERPDGTRRVFMPHPSPLRDGDGSLVGAVNVLIDMTEQWQMEQRLRDAALELRASNAIRDEFLGMVSHELRTPVTTIFGNARVLQSHRDHLDDRERGEMLSDIATDAERLLGLVENLLQLLKLGADARPDLEPQVLTEVVRRAIDSFVRRHPGRHVTLQPERERTIVDGDETYLGLVLENLLSNADKYSPAESVIEVDVRLTRPEVEVTINDSGIGLPNEPNADVFAPFYRSDTAMARANGLGIGLSVSRRAIELMGGRIWARQRPEGGAEFGFALPASGEN